MTIKAVIAWRLMAMTLLGRERPELGAEVLFSDMEILALKDFAQDRRLSLPDNLGATVVTLAMPHQRPKKGGRSLHYERLLIRVRLVGKGRHLPDG